MKLYYCLVFVISSTIVFASACRKSATSPQVYIPWDMDTLMLEQGQANQAIFVGKPFVDGNGAFIFCETNGTLTDTGANTISYLKQWSAAKFEGGYPGEGGANAGAVSLNSVGLFFLANYPHRYMRRDTAMLWYKGGRNEWSVSGSGFVSPFSADVYGALPSFRGALPTSISRENDFSLTFNTSNTSNGDMAYVVVYSRGRRYQSNAVSARGGTAVIKAAELKSAANEYLPLTGFYNEQSEVPAIYYGGFVVIVIYNIVMRKFNDRRYAFIQQRVSISNVTFQ